MSSFTAAFQRFALAVFRFLPALFQSMTHVMDHIEHHCTLISAAIIKVKITWQTMAKLAN